MQLKVFCAVIGSLLVSFYLSNIFFGNASEFLGLLTAYTFLWKTYVWNLVTCAVYEQSFIKIIIDLGILGFLSTSLLDCLPIEQFLIYIFFCIISSSLTVSAYCIVRFIATDGSEAMLLDPIFGCGGIIVSIVMYCRYKVGNKPICEKFLPWLTYGNFAPIYISCLQVCWLIRVRWLALDTPLVIANTLLSWSYLRFYYQDENSVVGNDSEEFQFVRMFPEVTHIVMIPLTTAFYNIPAIMGIFPTLDEASPLPRYYHHLRGPREAASLNQLSEHADAQLQETAPLVDPISERRKAKAQQLLEERMLELSKNGVTVQANDASNRVLKV